MTIMYHDGNRRLQDQFDSRRISDRLEEKLTRTAFTADDKAFIESTIYFFLSTADAEGRPDCSFKGGPPGFVRVTGELRTRVSGLRRQRHVQEPRQPAGQSERRPAVHRPARAAAPPARERHGERLSRGPAARRNGRRAVDRARQGARDLPELPALYPEDAAGRAFGLRAEARAAIRSSPPGRASTCSRTTSTRASRRRGSTAPRQAAAPLLRSAPGGCRGE